MNKKVIIEYLLLMAIIVVAFSLRFYKINNPIADWHSWRQADTSSVSRNFQKYGYDVLHPKFDDLSNLASGKENPMGYRMVEFPIYNLVQAKISEIFPQQTLEWWGRMVSILCSLGSLLFIYFLTKGILKWQTALLAAFFFAVLPYSVYYSRVILIEPMMVFTSLGAIYFFYKWTDREKFKILYYLLSLIFAILTLLLKPFAIFMLLPLFYFVWQKWQFNFIKKPSVYLYAILAVAPFILWRIWESRYPEGIPVFMWLLNSQDIRFKGAFFRWIFGERMARLIFGFWGLPLFVIGIIDGFKEKKESFFYFWLGSIILYFFVVAGGNVQHDYYQIIALPILCIFLAKGSYRLISNYSSKLISIPVFVICTIFLLAFSWYEVKGYYLINRPEIVIAGQEADRILPKSAKVVAMFGGDTAFLYQTNRQGWGFIPNSIEQLISKGASYYISVDFDETTQRLEKLYKVLEKTDQFIIIDLNSPKQ